MNIIFYSCEKSPVLKELFPNSILVNEPLTFNTINRITTENTLCIGYNDQLNDIDLIHALRSKGITSIITRSKGTDHINIMCCSTCDIKIYSIDYDITSVTEHILFLTLCMLRRAKNLLFKLPYNSYVSEVIKGKTIGIIGYGAIGEQIKRLIESYEPRIIFIHSKHLNYTDKIETILTKSDIIYITCALTQQTANLINTEQFNMLKPNCVMVNVARGNVVNHDALISHLQNFPNFFYTSDVVENENGLLYEKLINGTDDRINYLSNHPNVIITPHIAFMSKDTILSMCQLVKENNFTHHN